MPRTAGSGTESTRLYTRLELAQTAGISYSLARHWQEAGLLHPEPLPGATPAAPGSVQYLFTEQSVRKAVHIAELRRAGMSLLSVTQALGFMEQSRPQPVFVNAGDEPAMLLVPPKFLESMLGLLETCGIRAGKEVESAKFAVAESGPEWPGHSLDGVLLDGVTGRYPMANRATLDRRTFLRTAGLSVTAALAAACAGASPVPVESPSTPPAEATTAPTEPTGTEAPEATATPASTAQPEPTTDHTVAASRYQEAPMLAEMVAAGQLPPVEERLPRDPLVIEAISEIGTYSDTWHRCEVTPGMVGERLGAETLVTYDRDVQTIIPNLASSWETNADATELTIHLREGVRWSDGEPFDADDLVFWFEDVLLNEELSPAFPNWLKAGGEPCTMEKVDGYTVKFSFVAPAALILESLTYNGNSIINYPRHYLERFHTNYADADELAALTKERGFESWFQLFGNEITARDNPDLPTLRPWKIVTRNWSTTAVAERNPYYWKVDTEDKQLPYYDRIFWNIVQAPEMVPLRVVSGDVDMQGVYLGFPDYTLLMENREAGDYEVLLWNPGTSGSSMNINQTRTGDDEMRELLRDVRFRIAISQAINRQELNELFYFGLSQDVLELYPDVVKSDPDLPTYFQYDVDATNALLDEIGLDQRDGDGTRLLPSGRPLTLMLFGNAIYPIHRDVAEVNGEFFKAVGINTRIDFVANELFWTRQAEGSYDVLCYNATIGPGALFFYVLPRSLFPVAVATWWAPLWGAYYSSEGQNGEPPEGDAAYLNDRWDQVTVTMDPAERQAIVDEAYLIGARNLWIVPIFGGDIVPIIVKNGFTNVPEVGTFAYQVFSPKLYNPEHFFLKQT